MGVLWGGQESHLPCGECRWGVEWQRGGVRVHSFRATWGEAWLWGGVEEGLMRGGEGLDTPISIWKVEACIDGLNWVLWHPPPPHKGTQSMYFVVAGKDVRSHLSVSLLPQLQWWDLRGRSQLVPVRVRPRFRRTWLQNQWVMTWGYDEQILDVMAKTNRNDIPDENMIKRIATWNKGWKKSIGRGKRWLYWHLNVRPRQTPLTFS